MTQRKKILKTIEESMERINTIDNNIIGECIGVSHALDDLRKSLDKIEICLDKRTYSEASSLGYSDVASAFIFLQRTLGGLQQADLQKEELVSEIAHKSGVGVYEEVAPFVDDVLVSSKERSEEEQREKEIAKEKRKDRECSDDKFSEVEIEIEPDVLKWFQEHFEDWQAAMNAVLVLACEREKAKE